MPRPAMFISLKWKALVFLNVVLTLMAVAWIGQNVYQTVASFELERDELNRANQRSFNQLLVDRTINLTQLSLLFSENPLITNATSAEDAASSLVEFIHNKWFSLNINIELDYFAVYDMQGNVLGDQYDPQQFNELSKIKELLAQYIPLAHAQGPQSFLFCENACALFAIEPFLFSDSQEGYLVLAQNIANIVHRYNKFTGSDLAILIEGKEGRTANASRRYLYNWKTRIWAVSNFNNSVAKLIEHSEHSTLEKYSEHSLPDHEANPIRFNKLSPQSHDIYGDKTHFIDINDESATLQRLNDSIFHGIITGIVGLTVASLFSMAFMFGPLRRLSNIATALRLLPKQKYQEAREQVKRKPSATRDELTTLEASTHYSANKLSQLHRDIEEKNNELHQQLLVLSRSRTFLSQLFDSPHLFVLTMSSSFEILTSNNLFKSVRSTQQSCFLDMLSGKNKNILSKQLVDLLAGKQSSARFAFELFDPQGSEHYIAWSYTLVEDEDGNQVILAVGTDLSERRKAESALEWLVYHDSLTKLGNRRAFNEKIGKLFNKQKAGALMYITLNRFKHINDLYGHVVGDKVLIKVTESLKKLHPGNSAIYRLSACEFTVILPKITPEQLAELLNKNASFLMDSLTLPDRRLVEYSASLGVALFPEHGQTMQTVVAHADQAMHQAKHMGLGQWHIYDHKDNYLVKLEQENELIRLLKIAVSNSLFHLVFQPIQSIRDPDISHYEVLLRMQDEAGQAIFPDQFIPLAERVGLIRTIDFWVLEQALIRLSKELEINPKLNFSVNISAPSLQHSDFSARAIALIDQHEIAPQRLIIEITETAYIDNFDMVLNNLNELHSAGVAIAMDDFGVGYSSFSYLKRLPLTYVKIDGSYIKDLTRSPEDQVFVEGLSRMVDVFGMKTIAEFVEDKETLEILNQLGVTYAQGYYIGKPLPDLIEPTTNLSDSITTS